MTSIPEIVPNLIDGAESTTSSDKTVVKYNPATGEPLCLLTASDNTDVDTAVNAADKARKEWAALPGVQRGNALFNACAALQENREEIARIVALETGKSFNDALGETDGAISLGRFYAGEGQRLYGRTTTSGVDGKSYVMMRQPVGIAGLIIAANTPIANVAWKVFPALICGNTAILKGSEDSPATAWIFGKIVNEHLPHGTLNIIQGLGEDAGAPLVEHPDVGVISFTGSTAVGKLIARQAGDRLARVSLELGGKNPLVVCDDADLDNAVRWTILSAFSNAGQRCASASRLIVFDAVYEEFCTRLLEATKQLSVGPENSDDLGPVINARSLEAMTTAVAEARDRGVKILIGGDRVKDSRGYYMQPTLMENVKRDDPLSTVELFGPIASLYRVADFEEALEVANDSPYGLTSAIHTKNMDRAWEFGSRIETGMTTINGATFGSEPHMPFGGRKLSGNGTREPGTEALDIYCELKVVAIHSNPQQV